MLKRSLAAVGAAVALGVVEQIRRRAIFQATGCNLALSLRDVTEVGMRRPVRR